MSYARPGLAVLLAALGCNVFFSSQVRAEGSFLCEETGHRIRVGDPISRVLELCGEPDLQSQRLEQRRSRHVIRAACKDAPEISEERVVEVLVDDWVYDNGYNHRTRYLRFENNVLHGIYSRWVGSR